MDSHQDESNTNNTNSLNAGGGVVSKSSFLCRQSSSRWIPTGEQVRILRDLYYNCGVRSPSAEQIQKISARLRQYGKIEGKNVFYWFQNHKARERQKKRLTVDIPIPNPDSNSSTAKFPTTTMSPGVSGPCSPNLYGVEQMGSSGCDGSFLMERRFRESCISREGDGFEPTASPWMYHYAAAEQEASTSRKIETLPLFPVHSQDQEDQEVACDSHLHQYPTTTTTTTHYQPNGHFPAFYWGGGGGQQEEQDGHHHLELSLSSCYYTPPGPM